MDHTGASHCRPPPTLPENRSDEERLAHNQARLKIVEKLLADKISPLLISNQQVERADIRLKNIIDSMFSSLIITGTQGLMITP